MLKNKLSHEECVARLARENFKRIPVSLYRYFTIDDPQHYRDQLFAAWYALGVFGRTYVATEGINAQITVPEPNFEEFKAATYALPGLNDIRLNIGIDDGSGPAFVKLQIKVRPYIVADGLTQDEYQLENTGNHLNAIEFNEAIADEDAILIDMRNHYEGRIGHFKGAWVPPADTFREELPLVKEKLQGKEDKKIVMYCTGGIRCEKASAYLKSQGFKDVNQLNGGIINYFNQIKKENIENKFIGKNYVFDERRAESVTDDILTHCDNCGESCDTYTNCANVMCNLLFIQCEHCQQELENCCTPACRDIIHLSEAEQVKLRKQSKPTHLKDYKKSIRPELNQLRIK